MGFFRSSSIAKHVQQPSNLGSTRKEKDTTKESSMKTTLVYENDYIKKVTRLPSDDKDYQNPLFNEYFNNKSIRNGNPFNLDQSLEQELTLVPTVHECQKRDGNSSKYEEKQDEKGADTTTSVKPLRKRKSFYSLFHRKSYDLAPQEQIITRKESEGEEDITDGEVEKEYSGVEDKVQENKRKMKSEEDENDGSQERKRHTIRDFFRRSGSSSNYSNKDRVRLRDRIFGMSSAAKDANQEHVYEVQETLTQRYMSNNYATLLEDMDALPFDLSVKTSDQQSLHSKFSKMVNVFTPLRGGINYSYTQSPDFYNTEDCESAYANSVRFKSTQQLAKCISLGEIKNPYDVAKKLKDFDTGSITSNDIAFVQRSTSKFDLKPIEPVFGGLTKRISKRLGFRSGSTTTTILNSDITNANNIEISPFFDGKTTSTLQSSTTADIVSRCNFGPVDFEARVPEDDRLNEVSFSTSHIMSFSNQSSPIKPKMPSKARAVCLDTGSTLVYEEGVAKKNLEEKNDSKQSLEPLCSGSTLFNSLFDTVPEAHTLIDQNTTYNLTQRFNLLDDSSLFGKPEGDHEDYYRERNLDDSMVGTRLLNSSEIYQHPYESKSTKRFSLYSKPEHQPTRDDEMTIFKLQQEQLRRSLEEFRNELQENRIRNQLEMKGVFYQ